MSNLEAEVLVMIKIKKVLVIFTIHPTDAF